MRRRVYSIRYTQPWSCCAVTATASRAVLAAAAAAGAPFVACASYVSELPRYTYRQGPDGPGYYRHAGEG